MPKDGAGVKLSIETVFQGEAADYVRRSLGSERAEELARRYSDYYRKRYGELSVVSGAVMEDDRKANRIKLNEAYLLKAPFLDVGATKAIDMFAESLQSVSALPSSMARQGPLYFAPPGKYSHGSRSSIRRNGNPRSSAMQPPIRPALSTMSASSRSRPSQVDLRYELNIKRASSPWRKPPCTSTSCGWCARTSRPD